MENELWKKVREKGGRKTRKEEREGEIDAVWGLWKEKRIGKGKGREEKVKKGKRLRKTEVKEDAES